MEDDEREMARRDLEEYERKEKRWHVFRNWLIFISIALTITCIVFIQKWQEEKTFRIVAQAVVEYYRLEAEQWQDRYWELKLDNEGFITDEMVEY